MRRLISFVVALVLAASFPAAPAGAWRNGGDSGNGYGTHDWVLDEAIRLAGTDGAWIDRDVALLATDDPDSEGTSKRLHVFYERGIYGGAPTMVTDLYYEAVEAYRTGDRERASRAIGTMSHYYSDVTNPFHAAAAAARSPLHNAYEMAVEDLTSEPGVNRDWVTSSTATSTADVRLMTVRVAALSRRFYPALLASFSASGTIETTLPVVHDLTVRMLDRACADLAAVIASVPGGGKIAGPPARMRADMSRHTVSWGSTPCARMTCLDASGTPISGVAVVFSWPTDTGAVSVVRYTDPHGVARCWKTIGRDPLNAKMRVTAIASASGTSTTAATWYTAGDMLATGSAGLRTTLSSYHPRRGSVVIARAYARDASGGPVEGLNVTFSWKYRTKTVTAEAVTDASGVARCARNIGAATRGYRVRVGAQVVSGPVRCASTSFVPR